MSTNTVEQRTQHTPGPWYQNGQSIRSLFGHNEDRQLIADVSGLDCDESEFAANARLIAAAPELFDAARRAITDLELAHGGRENITLRNLRAAIAKAEGRE